MTRSVRRPLVAVVGDATLAPESSKEILAEEVGRSLVDAGYRVLTGGLGGVMEAACRGARSSPKSQPGDTVGILPGHDPGEANPFVDIVIASGLDHARNTLVAHADAVVAIGGGAGTMTEICFAWIYKRLVIGMRVDGWSGRIADARVDDRVRYPDIPDDRVRGADSPEDVVRIISEQLPRHAAHHRGVRRRG